jgi:EF hand
MKLNTLHTVVAALASVAALSITPSTVQAQAAAPKAEKAMMSADDVLRLLDKNGDGLVDREEAKADPVLDKNFTAINKSGSGKITRDELDAFMVKK